MALPPPKLAVSRRTMPGILDGATAYSQEPAGFLDELNMASRITGYGNFATLMDERVIVKINNGRPRDAGRHWLAYMCWVPSKEPSLLPWYNKMTPGFWAACGFTHVPSYKTVWLRFRELERFEEHFRWATNHFIEAARRRDPRIGAFVYVDGTEVRSHAQPRYNGPVGGGTRRKRSPRFRMLSTDEARLQRQHDNAEPVDEVTTTKASRTRLPGGGQRFQSGGHYWVSRDPDAGLRSYGNGTHWYGYYHHKVVDMATGAVICVEVHAADESEADAFPRVYERAVHAIGADPVAVVGDKGYSLEHIYEFLTERGVTGVFPWRRRNGSDPYQAPAGPDWDFHGVPTCRHCGASGNFVRFSTDGGGRTWFDCSNPTTPACNKTQTIYSSREPRRLLPIWRTSPTYGLLMEHGQQFERVHKEHRERFRSGGKHFIERVRMMGQSCLQLRATAACVIEWLLVLDRQGWLNPGQTERAAIRVMEPKGAFTRIMRRRRRDHIRGGEWRPHRAPPRTRPKRSPVRTP